MLNQLPSSSFTRSRQLGYLIKGPKGPLDALDAVWKLSVGNIDTPIQYGKPLQAVVWNMQKNKKGSLDILESMWGSFGVNLAMVQELQMHPSMEKETCSMFETKHATLVTNIFMHKNERGPSGVCTISDAQPSEIIPMLPKPKEPFGVSKPGLGMIYKIEGSDENLSVWNLHAINYVNIREYRRYLTAVAEEMAKHTGPKVVAGDFNTWSKRREDCTQNFCKLFDLQEIEFQGPIKKFRGHVLDRVLVSKKGIRVSNAHSLNYKKHSDHNPLLFEMEVTEE
jgi:endonuclease/exonuclease/phosphatase (EEP) superfamily protein YafD